MPGLGPKRKKPRVERAALLVVKAKASKTGSRTIANNNDDDEASDSDDEDDSAVAVPLGFLTPLDKLIHKSSKEIKRSVKKYQTNELRKAIKRLKTSSGNEAAKNQQEATMKIWKELDSSLVSDVCLRRLGIKFTGVGNCPLEKYITQMGASGEGKAEEMRSIYEKVIDNKDVSSLLNKLNKDAVEFRQREMAKKDADAKLGKGKINSAKNKRKRDAEKKGGDDNNEWSKIKKGESSYQRQTGVFLTLNGDAPDDDEGEGEGVAFPVGKYDSYGPGGEAGGEDEWANVVQKNRKGQRARRAKAQAKEANKRGEKWDKSVNWRPKKETTEEGAEGGVNPNNDINLTMPKEGYAKEKVGQMGKEWKDEGKMHPSWAAKNTADKKGIAEFTGKKITFD
jgi:hypothetical protein